MWWTGSPARPEKRFLAGRYLLQMILCKRGSNGDPSDDGSEAPQAGRRCFSRRADELHKRGLSGCILLGRRHSRAAAFAAAALFWIVTAMLASHLPARRARAWTRLWPSAGNK
jgi:hypothetical protein